MEKGRFRISCDVDRELWNRFSALASMMGFSKTELMGVVLTDFIKDNKDRFVNWGRSVNDR